MRRYGWDACQVKPGPGNEPWIDFDLKAPTTIDGFALCALIALGTYLQMHCGASIC